MSLRDGGIFGKSHGWGKCYHNPVGEYKFSAGSVAIYFSRLPTNFRSQIVLGIDETVHTKRNL